MAAQRQAAVILDITCWPVPGCALLGLGSKYEDALFYIAGGAFIAAYLVVEYFRWREQG